MKQQRILPAIDQWSLREGPLHERLAGAIEDAIRLGNLRPGMRIPAERALARELAISRTTVLSAYNHLRDRGWVESRAGSGTWIARRTATAARSSAHQAVLAQNSLASLFNLHESCVIDFALNTTLPLNIPDTFFAIPADLRNSLLHERKYMAMGLPLLREAVANHYSALGVPTRQEQVLVTTGAQQAISLITALLVQPGDWIISENPTFFGALEAFRLAGARIVPLEISDKHVLPEALFRKLNTHSPRMIYITPTNQNPTGASMPETSRRELARLSCQYSVPLIEDETLAEISFGAKRPRPVAAYADDGPVLTIGSMSKLFLAGLRVGWIRGPVALISRLAKLKTTADLGSPQLTQAIGWQLFSRLAEAVQMRRVELSEKRRELAELLRTRFPEWTFAEDRGALSLWVRTGTDTRILAQIALRHQLALAPGSLFSVDESFSEYLRIPFTDDSDTIQAGVECLAKAWLELRKQTAPAASVPAPLV